LLYVKNDVITEYRVDEIPFPEAENYIDIIQAGYRTDDTYLEARRRWKRRHRKN
jgi:hypothetical protein